MSTSTPDDYPTEAVYNIGFADLGQRQRFQEQLLAAAIMSGATIIETESQSPLFETGLQHRLDEVILETDDGIDSSTTLFRAARVLGRDALYTFRDVFVVGEEVIKDVPNIGSDSVTALNQYLLPMFPEMNLLERPTASDIARFCTSLDQLDLRAAVWPLTYHVPYQGITIQQMLSEDCRASFRPNEQSNSPSPNWRDNPRWRESYTLAHRLAFRFARDFEAARAARGL